MQATQHEHIATVMRVAADGIGTPGASAHDEIIRASWSRCVHEHRLDPTRMQAAVILPSERLREHRDRIDAFLHIARHGLEALYRQVAGLGYCVLLTDARGVTVDFLGDLQLDSSLRKAGLYLGADWSEQHAGTCGVGTAIATGESLTVHLADHFDATHIPLTCTTAPVFDAQGHLNAILDISALSSPQPKASQHLALQLVRTYAQHIENAAFLDTHRNDWVCKLGLAPQFLELNPDYLVALDDGGHVIGHNRRAQQLLQAEIGPGLALLGQPIGELLDVTLEHFGRFVPLRPAEQRRLSLAKSGTRLFMLASPPPVRRAVQAPAPAAASATPATFAASLAALSGGDPALDRQIERAARLVDSPVSLLLTGETGSGKEHFAKAIHEASRRRGGPFVAVNCAAIPETLIESELFGHLPGSFSGAGARPKRGLVQAADGGTLFLDEIGDMPLALQARLLRVLAEHEVLPIGATKPLPVDLRVIAATHCDLPARVRDGSFRADLYYRLNGAQLALPPLRERHDFGWLVQRLLGAGHRDGESAPRLSARASERLRSHAWPGNLRELRNALDYARAVCRDGLIDVGDLPDTLSREAAPPARASVAALDALAGPPPGLPPALSPEAALLVQYLRAAHWNVSVVARQLGLSRMTLYRRMKRFDIRSPNRQPH